MPKDFTELKRGIIDYLSGLKDFEGTTVAAAFPEKQRVYPLKSPFVVIGIAGVKCQGSGLGGYLGGDTPTYGTSAMVTFRFALYHPSAEGCGRISESLCLALFSFPGFNFLDISCDKCQFDSKTAAFVLECTATLKTAWALSMPEERLFTQAKLV